MAQRPRTRKEASGDLTNTSMKNFSPFSLFVPQCPHCRRKVGGRDRICPLCDRWLIGDMDWSRNRRIRRGSVFVVSVMSTVAIIYWIFIRYGVFPL